MVLDPKNNNQPSRLLSVEGLKTHFHTFEGVAKAVDGVSFSLDAGETLGLVGESGCGKSVTAQSIMRLIPEPPGRIVEGRILFNDHDLAKADMQEMRRIRGNRISMIFQEPMTSLNPVFTIGDQLAEMYLFHRKESKKTALERAIEMLQLVQIPAAHKRVEEYPHQLSGGMRQRVMIAMALALNPEILIADEPTTALDVTIQAQILELMLELKQAYDAAIILITHDLGVIAEVAQKIAVMYAGKIVEQGPTKTIFKEAFHPYTKGLLKSIPKLGERARQGRRRLTEIKGMVPSLYELPQGCSFYPRCPKRMDICKEKMPELTSLSPKHLVRCWLNEDA
ncbi:ABC transporter ATP-binding protein [Dethiosulfatarculus sandiegensis]|uniref:Peptide ABC transporter ATP-binding protein n=1 Tax=Dethiosulfatarculus sandiegensis TaxID=1429043 RepID=A0A0D2HV31_9BACT|nr:ABC transporter ATP-binding protein [Dethiosulfatarculus sandiegensis]KIX14283.1 peptide ABC transporter ATP-binding protein [Dethiosulfatarculus sandiegensis]